MKTMIFRRIYRYMENRKNEFIGTWKLIYRYMEIRKKVGVNEFIGT